MSARVTTSKDGSSAMTLLLLLVLVDTVVGSQSWSAWSSWTVSCPRQCSDMFGFQNRRRTCLVCDDVSRCFPVTRPTQNGRCTGVFEEHRKCYDPSECVGAGHMTGEWSSWQNFGPCKVSKPRDCDVIGTQYQSRKCLSPHKVQNSSSFQCPVDEQFQSLRQVKCVKSCTSGRTGRKRGTTPHRGRRRAVDGGWSSWSTYFCDVTCGKGIMMRFRTCTDPHPVNGGKDCPGYGEETKEDCVMHDCPQHGFSDNIPEQVEGKVKDLLANMYQSFERVEHQTVTFVMSLDLYNAIYALDSDLKIRWLHNTHSLDGKFGERIQLWGGDLLITSVQASDNGVWVCTIVLTSGKHHTVGVYSLVVKTNQHLHTHVGRDLQLSCNGAALGRIYHGLQQMWFHNGQVYKDYKATPPQTVNTEYFQHITVDYAGLWECIISEPGGARMWITNRVNVTVEPLTLFQQLSQNKLYLYGFIATCASCVLGVFLGCIYLNKKRDLEAATEAESFKKLIDDGKLKLSAGTKKERKPLITESSSVDSDDGLQLKDGGTIHTDGLMSFFRRK